MKKIMTVEGMTCAHCKARVEKVLSAVPGVSSASVDLRKKAASVVASDDVSDEALCAVVTDAGYEVVSIR